MTAAIDRTASVTLVLPYDRPPKGLYANVRTHWRQRSTDTLQVRSDVTNLAKAAHLHRIAGIRHITAQLVWAPGDRRRRDEDNLYPLFKVICDALARGRSDLVGLDLVPDDTPTYMQKLGPRIDPPPAPKGMWLHLTLTLGAES